MAHRLTTCTFCGVGCGLYLETAGGRLIGVSPSMSHPANRGKICVRGWHVHEVASSPDRLRTPLLKRRGRFQEASWSEAIDFIARRLKDIRDRAGPDALAFLNSPRCSNEESYLLQKLARVVLGTNNVDHGAGVYSHNSVGVLLTMLGVPATTSSIADLSRSEVILVDGVDLARQMPTIGGVVIRSRLNGARLVVIDPRRHRVAESADIFLQINPGTEASLYGALAKVVVDRGLMDLPFIKAHCRNYDAFLAATREFDLLSAAGRCGVGPDLIESAALAFARAGSAAILYSTGIESRSAEAIAAMVNLALLTGRIGRAGSGVFALTEHNNLQGVCDMGMLPDRLPGYGAVTDPAARAGWERLFRVEPPVSPGLTARSVLTDLGAGRVRGVWLCRYDPVQTAFFGDAAESLRRCELVVAQHLFRTETAEHAHVILPTTAFGEERVSFTSTERRIQLAEQVIEPPPGPLPAWQQLTLVARALGADWNYPGAADVMEEIGRVVPFYSGAAYDNLARDYGRQWPCTKDRPLGQARLFADGLPERGFQFVPIRPEPAAAAGPAELPFRLFFGHSLYYWHRNVLIQHSETLRREYRILLLDYPDGFVEINDTDAARLGVRDGEAIRLRSAAGSAVAAARVTAEVRCGSVFVPYFVPQVQRQILGPAADGIQSVPVALEKEAA
jgi:predicted molibdopterin-dependent oxidoreductase YjgC